MAAAFTAHYVLKSKIETFLNSGLPEHIQSTYDELHLNLLQGSLSLRNVAVSLQNKGAEVAHTHIRTEAISIEAISYWDYLFKEKIHVGAIKFEKPIITHHKNKVVAPKDTSAAKPLKLQRSILVDQLEIANSTLLVLDGTKDSVSIFSRNLSFELAQIFIDQKTLQQPLPLQFADYSASCDSIFLKSGKYEHLEVSSFQLANQLAIFEGLRFYTKYTRKGLSRVIAVERDHIDVHVEKTSVKGIDFGFMGEKFFAKSELIALEKPSANVYRDKLLTDDRSIKPLYSKLLRELPFDLAIDSMTIHDGFIKYTERVKADNSGGHISFSKFNARISQVSNTYVAPEKTRLDINTTFMERTPLHVDWSFDVNDANDRFAFSAKIGKLPAADMNQFTEPNLLVRLKGEVKTTFLNIDASDYNANVAMKISYTDFKVVVLSEDRRKRNHLMCIISNLFIAKDSHKDGDIYRGAESKVTRDRTKSIFNYFWINAKQGLIDSLTGSGKNE